MNISQLQKGEFAWRPNRDISDHDYDVVCKWNGPSITSFKLSEETVIACVVDEPQPNGKETWFYVSLTEEESDFWETAMFDDVFDMIDYIEKLTKYSDRLIVEVEDGRIA